MMSFFFVESIGKKIYFSYCLLYRLDKMTFLDPWNLRFHFGKEGLYDLFDLGRVGLGILKKAFEIVDDPFGVSEKISCNENLIDHMCLYIKGHGDPDQPPGCFEDRG